MKGEKIEKIRYNNPVYLHEESRAAEIEYRLTNPFPKDELAESIFLKIISKNRGFRTQSLSREIIIYYKGIEWAPQVKQQLDKIIPFALFETRRLVNKIGEHELTRGF